jgi:hypothetical protein
MAEILGPQNILSLATPTGTDAEYMLQWKMQDGITFAEFLNRAALAIGELNTQMVNRWGWMFGLTTEPMMEYMNGGAITKSKQITDLTQKTGLHGDTISHMIDLIPWGDKYVGGTSRYFRDSRPAKIRADITTLLNTLRERFEYELFWRLFVDDEVQLRTSGYNVGFVTSSGNVVFTPPAYDGKTFASHTHYVGYNLSTPKTFADVFNGLAKHVEEHGHKAPFTAIVSGDDIDTISAVSGIIQIVDTTVQVIDRGGATSGNEFYTTGTPELTGGVFARYQSKVGRIDLRASHRVPTGQVALFKSYGTNDPRNPLAVRVHPSQGFGCFIVPKPTGDFNSPIEKIEVEMEFGVGVGEDRTNGARGFLVAGGTYADPTIS